MVAPFRPTRRLGVALGLSLLAHALIAADWGGFPGERVPRWQVEARLEAHAVSAPVAERPQPHTPVAPVVTSSFSAVRNSAAETRKQQAPAAALNNPGDDRHFYSARELDQYPEPLSRQELLAGAPVSAVRVWVSIDREGIVRDVVAADAAAQVDAALERLLTIRFQPARRAGLPVNSRVMMELSGR